MIFVTHVLLSDEGLGSTWQTLAIVGSGLLLLGTEDL